MIQFTYEQYARDVLAGRVLAGQLARQMAARFMDDLAHGHRRGLRFDHERARLAVAFYHLFCRHAKGEHAGQPFELEPWQQFHVANLFGWLRPDGARRFRTSYLEVARKNGKSTLASGLGLQMLMADGEAGSEVYVAATKKEQARIIFDAAVDMVGASPTLGAALRVYRSPAQIFYAGQRGKLEPLSADHKKLDGLNVHCGLIDELHAHPTGFVYDVLDTGTGARVQPLMYSITTAGNDATTICHQLHQYTRGVLDGSIEDDTFFGGIYALDEGDDWESPEVWGKANPNLNISKYPDGMLEKYQRARHMPARAAAFKQKELNIWGEATAAWLDVGQWRMVDDLLPKGVGKIRDIAKRMAAVGRRLSGRPCYAGLDLSSNIDLTALVLVFVPVDEHEPYWVWPRFFVPADNLAARWETDRVPYPAWRDAGLITATPGNVIDYDYVLEDLRGLRRQFDVGRLAFDRWGARLVVQKLIDEYGEDFVADFGQGFASMSAPSKLFETLVLQHRIGHWGHPVLRWMAGNAVARQDAAGNIKPDKERSRERIDGLVALIMALDLITRDKPAPPSRYKKSPIRFVG